MSSSGAQEKNEENPEKPLWKYVTRKKSIDGGGNFEFVCSFCHLSFKGSYTRVKAHLLKISGKGIRVCGSIVASKLEELKKIENEATLKSQSSKAKHVPLPSLSSQSENYPPVEANVSGTDSRKRRAAGPLENAFNMQAREILDYEIARMFYSSGLPFHLARNPHFVKSFSFAANNYISGYVPPGYNKLRTILLEKERENVDKLLEPIRNTWSQKGVSIVSDGWSDPQRRPLINFMAVTESGPMFLKAIDCSDEIKDKDFIAKQMRDVIVEVGLPNIVQIITDNAPVCRAAGLIIEAEFPTIYWTPCVVHTLNLALKNICAANNSEKNSLVYQECSWITEIAEDAAFIKNFIVGHTMRLSIFNEFVPLKLLNIAPTRFASTIVMLRRFKLVKHGLQEMVISEKWSFYKEDDVGKAEFVKEKLLSDSWWQKIDFILSFTNPIYDVLRSTDTDAPTLHLVYEMWDSMIEKVKKAIYQYERKDESEESTFYNVVHSILIERWTRSSTPLHCLAHSLNPRYYSHEWLSQDPQRVPPHQDVELTNERIKCLKRYFPSAEDRRKVNIEFAKFSDGREGFDDCDSINDRGVMDAKSWWLVHGVHAPILQKIALKLLGQPCSSSCCERNWSTYSFIHSLKRNKMKPKRAKNLVYVHTNLRLLSRKTPQYKKGETRMWDIAGDEFSPIDDDHGILEVANLSLDEPELESVIFVDEGTNNNGGEHNEVNL